MRSWAQPCPAPAQWKVGGQRTDPRTDLRTGPRTGPRTDPLLPGPRRLRSRRLSSVWLALGPLNLHQTPGLSFHRPHREGRLEVSQPLIRAGSESVGIQRSQRSQTDSKRILPAGRPFGTRNWVDWANCTLPPPLSPNLPTRRPSPPVDQSDRPPRLFSSLARLSSARARTETTTPAASFVRWLFCEWPSTIDDCNGEIGPHPVDDASSKLSRGPPRAVDTTAHQREGFAGLNACPVTESPSRSMPPSKSPSPPPPVLTTTSTC